MRFLKTLLASCLMMMPGLVADDGHEAAANELLDTIHFEKTYNLMFDAAQEGLAPEMVPVYKAYRALLTKYMSPEELRTFMADAYSQAFTVDELKTLEAFYRTELGQKTLTAMPQLGQKVSQFTQEVLLTHFDELKELIAEASKQ